MIWVFNVEKPEELFRIHGVWEHTNPMLQNTFIVHFIVDQEEFQYVYVAQLWSDVIPKILNIWEFVTQGIEVIVVNADIMICEVPPDYDEYPKIP